MDVTPYHLPPTPGIRARASSLGRHSCSLFGLGATGSLFPLRPAQRPGLRALPDEVRVARLASEHEELATDAEQLTAQPTGVVLQAALLDQGPHLGRDHRVAA